MKTKSHLFIYYSEMNLLNIGVVLLPLALYKKLSFPLRVSSVNVTKSGHIY